MNCVILQPSYIPWRGYFHQIQKADVFVFYDDVQYDRNGWRNRNQILTRNGPGWLTVPVHASGFRKGLRGLDVPIAWDVRSRWNTEHLATLRHAYARAPYFATYSALLEEQLMTRHGRLVDLLIPLTIAIARALGITSTHFVRSSELGIDGDPTDRIVDIVKSVGADHYVSGPSAAAYLDEVRLQKAGLSLEYMKYEYPEYPQLGSRFYGQLSIVDLLMMTGPKAPQYIWAS
jgi:hypothetical protein